MLKRYQNILIPDVYLQILFSPHAWLVPENSIPRAAGAARHDEISESTSAKTTARNDQFLATAAYFILSSPARLDDFPVYHTWGFSIHLICSLSCL